MWSARSRPRLASIGLALALLWAGAAQASGERVDSETSGSAPAGLASSPAAPGPEWPGFRGANRDGVSLESGLLDSWPEDGPPVAWRIAGGAGYSGVSVAGERAYTLWQKDGAQTLVALDVADGRKLWERRLGDVFNSQYGDGPRSTPVIDAGRVFAIDAHGHLAAVGADDGRPIWSHDLASEFGARIPSIGYASTPLVEGELLLVEVGAEERAFMAFDKSTGRVVWASQSDEPAYVSPIVFTAAGRRQVVFFSADGLYALAPADGRLLWHHPWPSPCPATGIPLNAASPVFIPPDRLFVSSAYGEKKGGAVLRLVERDGAIAVEPLWHAPLIDSEINTSVFVDGYLYGFKGSIFVSVDAGTGELEWSARGFGRGSLISSDGKLIVLGEQGLLALVEASADEYRETASGQLLSGRTWTPPALADGRLFVRNGAEVVAVELSGRPGRDEDRARPAAPAG